MGTLARRERFAGRWQVAALLFLPLVLLVIGKDWIFPSLTHDPWIYLGYGLDPWRMLARYADKYYSSRLSIILPVAVAHHLMPPVPAHLLIHLLLYYVSVFSIYDLVGSELGYRTGFLTALTLGTSFFFLDAMGRDYYDSFGIAYLLASLWLISKNRGARYGPLWTAASGACSAALVTSYLAHLVFVPFVVVGYLLLRGRIRGVAGVLVDAAAFIIGALALTAVFCLVSRETMGDPWFLGPSLAFVRYTMKAGSPLIVNGRSEFKFGNLDWVAWAVWLALPVAVVLVSFIASMARSRLRPGAGDGACRVWRLLCLGQFLLFLTLDSTTKVCVFLQGWSSAAMLLPLSMLAFGTLITRSVEGLDARSYLICAQSALILLFAQAVLPLPQNAYPESSILPLLIALAPALASLLVALCCRGRWSLIASFALLAASGLASRAGFREDKSCPVFAGSHTSPRFQETLRSVKLLPYVRRIHQYDSHRMDAFLAIVDSVRYVKSYDTRNDVIYWFDMMDPHAIVYDNLACTRCWGYSVLNFNFPNVTEAKKFDLTEVHAGQLVAIPSVRSDAYDFAKLALAGIGFDARLVDRREIARGVIKFTITLVELQPLDKPKTGAAATVRPIPAEYP